MPPHCDAMDGPVVNAAREALDKGDVNLALRFVPDRGEAEVAMAFQKARAVRELGPEAAEIADLHFFETVVRLHRAGENAPYTGLKPAGLDHGPVIPVAERAIETGSPEELIAFLARVVHDEAKRRLDAVMELRARAGRGLPELRTYTSAMLGLQVWSNALYGCATEDPHEQHQRYERHEG